MCPSHSAFTTMISVHVCTTLSVHACTMVIIHAFTMFIVRDVKAGLVVSLWWAYLLGFYDHLIVSRWIGMLYFCVSLYMCACATAQPLAKLSPVLRVASGTFCMTRFATCAWSKCLRLYFECTV